jgi:hypothetical protein
MPSPTQTPNTASPASFITTSAPAFVAPNIADAVDLDIVAVAKAVLDGIGDVAVEQKEISAFLVQQGEIVRRNIDRKEM